MIDTLQVFTPEPWLIPYAYEWWMIVWAVVVGGTIYQVIYAIIVWSLTRKR